MHLLGFKHLTNQFLHLHDTRSYFKHSNTSILEQMILQLIAGYDTDSAANISRNDPIWQLLLEKNILLLNPPFLAFYIVLPKRILKNYKQ